ncbi:MAG: alpha-amylase family glycosyl hydrolase [Rubricoccaceae bacterium]
MKRHRTIVLTLLAALHWPPSAMAQPVPPPAWVQDAVFYQVFPERFANGDPANDPPFSSLDFPDRLDPATWRLSPWTGDWYVRDDWERALGPDFYQDGAFFRRYGGDLQGLRDRLPYLQRLGVTALYLNPVFHAASQHKYDATSFHHVDPYFGPDPAGDLARIAAETPDDPATWTWTAADRLFLELLQDARARGLRVIIDGVFNHTGTRFFAFEDVRARQRASRFAGWYRVTAWDDPADGTAFDWEGWFGFKPLPVFARSADGQDLHPDAKAYVFAATRRWMDPDGDGDPSDGVDGWRLDAADELPHGFWRDWNALVRQINPDAYTVAEVWPDATAFVGEAGFHAATNYHGFAIPTHEALVTGRMPMTAYAEALAARAAAYPPASARARLTLMDSHDTDRLPSMLVNRALGHGYDRGNSPRHDARYSVRAPGPEERELQRLVTTLQFALPGAPMLYYGAEAGMWGADDPDDRKPMVWPDLVYDDEAADPLGRPRTPDPVAFDEALFAFHQELIALRRGSVALRRGDLRILGADDDAQTLALARAHGADLAVVLVNRSDAAQFVRLPGGAPEGAGPFGPLAPVFASSGRLEDVPSLVLVLSDAGAPAAGYRLPPRTAVVFRPAAATDVRPRSLDE